MKRLMVGGLLAGLVLVGGGAAYVWFSGGSGEPSTPLTAPPVSTTAIAPTPSGSDLATSTTSAGAGPVTFEIVPVESRVTFEIGEVLRGKPQQVARPIRWPVRSSSTWRTSARASLAPSS